MASEKEAQKKIVLKALKVIPAALSVTGISRSILISRSIATVNHQPVTVSLFKDVVHLVFRSRD